MTATTAQLRSRVHPDTATGQDRAAPPNVLIVLVDQLRFPRYAYGDNGCFAADLKDIVGFQGEADGDNAYRGYFPGLWSLRRHSVVLRKHTIASSACIPSRSALMTGQYGARTGVTQTDGLFKSGDSPGFPWLAADGVPTLGHWFRGAGYSTHYFGKWHVSNPSEHSLHRYGFDDWESSWPEPHGSSINNLGTYRDVGFRDLVCGFLRSQGLGMPYNRRNAERDPEQDAGAADAAIKPWLAVASFANPHDIATYPGLPRGLDPDAAPAGPLRVPAQGALANAPESGSLRLPLNPHGFPQDNAAAPPNLDETLDNKPACQFDYAYKMGLALASKTGLAAQESAGLDPVEAGLLAGIPFQLTADPHEAALRFVQYYAWLQHMVDGHIRSVLDALDESGQRDDTIVVFMADHGEYGAAHHYMIEKWHTAYQETLHVPVVIQSARINPEPGMRQIDALTSHIDIVPTLLGLAGLGEDEIARIGEELRRSRPVPAFPGADLSAVIRGEAAQPREADGREREGVLFVTDDEITERLRGDRDPHQARAEQEFEIFLGMVEAVREGSSGLPHKGPVPRLAPGPVRQPNHVRCVRSGEWKLVRYWDPNGIEADQWELYDLEHDGCENTNLLVTDGRFPTPIAELHQRYTATRIEETAHRLEKLLRRYEREMLSSE